jgi:hypothetical protein
MPFSPPQAKLGEPSPSLAGQSNMYSRSICHLCWIYVLVGEMVGRSVCRSVNLLGRSVGRKPLQVGQLVIGQMTVGQTYIGQ